MKKIFVYGSLMSSYWNHDKVLKNRVRSIERGMIQGDLYHLPEGYPAAIEGENLIYGEVCSISQEKILKSLDVLEGYLGEGEDNLYERKKRKVTYPDGREEECWTYIYVDDTYAKAYGKWVEGGDWKKFKERYKH